jgi:hypothetical protein
MAGDPDDADVLSFRVTTANLNGVIQKLRERGGLAEYPVAYQVLVLERSRREPQSPPQEIRLTRDAVDGLPHEVQHLLMAQPDECLTGTRDASTWHLWVSRIQARRFDRGD